MNKERESFFAYDLNSPPMAEDIGIREEDGAQIRDLSYASPCGGRVPAYLVTPAVSRDPLAGVVFMHPGQGDRSTFLSEAVALAGIGVASLLLDAAFRRAESAAWGRIPSAAADRSMYIQTVVDIRRGLDLLLARPDVDPHRLAYVGHSYGATWGGPLAGVERRLKALVLMAGYPSLTEWHRTSEHPAAARFRARFTPEAFEAYLQELAPLDGWHYIGQAAPAALLLQFARHDEFVTQTQAEQYFAAASEPKEMRWYESDHFLNAQARVERAEWLAAQLGLGSLPTRVLERLRTGASASPGLEQRRKE